MLTVKMIHELEHYLSNFPQIGNGGLSFAYQEIMLQLGNNTNSWRPIQCIIIESHRITETEIQILKDNGFTVSNEGSVLIIDWSN